MNDKSTFFFSNKTICCGGKIREISQPIVMGILNITPDSFFDGGEYEETDRILKRANTLLTEGADIIDIGAVSSRPGAVLLPLEEEINKLVPVLQLLRKEFPSVILSVDTCWSEVAEQAADNGADIINDISGGQFDKRMFQSIAKIKLPYILMHTQGMPQTMQQNPVYKNVVEDVMLYFAERLNKLYELGVNDVIIDPGFGFGKTLGHNFELINRLDEFSIFKELLLVGISRKSMVCKTLHCNPDQALNGTTVLHALALLKGASILRVHDVKEAKECIKIIQTAHSFRQS